MSLCREWTVVKHVDPFRYAKPLKCRSWGCELCAPDRKRQLMALAAAGEPTRFLTLTVNPNVGESQENRLRLLAGAWRICVKRLRRMARYESLQFLAVVEETKAGEPHLHILLRCPYIPHSLLSGWMHELLGARIVDIRAIHSQRSIVRYVAKYITKAPKQFGSAKRYWTSQHYALDTETAKAEHPEIGHGWKLVKEPLIKVISDWLYEGYISRRDHGDVIIGWYSSHFLNAPP